MEKEDNCCTRRQSSQRDETEDRTTATIH